MNVYQPSQQSVIFADSNVFIEALFLENSPAASVIRLVALGLFELVTSKLVIEDVENAILNKIKKSPKNLNYVIERWNIIIQRTRLTVQPNPPANKIRATYDTYIKIMRHQNDIPVLAAAIQCKPDYILSGNREHFNDAVAKKCGIVIYSCVEFVEMLAQ